MGRKIMGRKIMGYKIMGRKACCSLKACRAYLSLSNRRVVFTTVPALHYFCRNGTTAFEMVQKFQTEPGRAGKLMAANSSVASSTSFWRWWNSCVAVRSSQLLFVIVFGFQSRQVPIARDRSSSVGSWIRTANVRRRCIAYCIEFIGSCILCTLGEAWEVRYCCW